MRWSDIENTPGFQQANDNDKLAVRKRWEGDFAGTEFDDRQQEPAQEPAQQSKQSQQPQVQEKPKEQAQPQEINPSRQIMDKYYPKPERGVVGEIYTGVKRGVVGELQKMVGQATKWASDKGSDTYNFGQGLVDSAETRLNRPENQLNPESHNVVTNALASGAEMLAPSIAIPAVVGAGIAALPEAAVSGAVGLGVSALAGAVPMGMSQAQDTYENVQKAGGTDEAARIAGWKSGAIETGGETIGTYLGGKLLGISGKLLSKSANKGVGGIISNATDKSLWKPYAKQLFETAVGETVTEMGQSYGEAKVEQNAGVDVNPNQQAIDAIAPTLGMTALLAPFGLAGHFKNSQRAGAIDQMLADPNAAPPEARLAVVNMLHDEAVNNEVPGADYWFNGAVSDVAKGIPVRRSIFDMTKEQGPRTQNIVQGQAPRAPFTGPETIKRYPENQEDPASVYQPMTPPLSPGQSSVLKKLKSSTDTIQPGEGIPAAHLNRLVKLGLAVKEGDGYRAVPDKKGGSNDTVQPSGNQSVTEEGKTANPGGTTGPVPEWMGGNTAPEQHSVGESIPERGSKVSENVNQPNTINTDQGTVDQNTGEIISNPAGTATPSQAVEASPQPTTIHQEKKDYDLSPREFSALQYTRTPKSKTYAAGKKTVAMSDSAQKAMDKLEAKGLVHRQGNGDYVAMPLGGSPFNKIDTKINTKVDTGYSNNNKEIGSVDGGNLTPVLTPDNTIEPGVTNDTVQPIADNKPIQASPQTGTTNDNRPAPGEILSGAVAGGPETTGQGKLKGHEQPGRMAGTDGSISEGSAGNRQGTEPSTQKRQNPPGIPVGSRYEGQVGEEHQYVKDGKSYWSKEGPVEQTVEQITPTISKTETKSVVSKAENTDKSADKQVHDYSNTQVAIKGEAANKITSFGDKIPDAELYIDPNDDSYGREKKPHVTVRYGLSTDNPADVKGLSSLPPFKAKLGKVSIFSTDKYDVVKAEIVGDSIHAANKKVGELVDVPGETFTDYQPHATIAYVKKGEGKKYVGNTDLEGHEIDINSIDLTNRTGKTHTIKLEGKQLPPDNGVSTSSTDVVAPQEKPSPEASVNATASSRDMTGGGSVKRQSAHDDIRNLSQGEQQAGWVDHVKKGETFSLSGKKHTVIVNGTKAVRIKREDGQVFSAKKIGNSISGNDKWNGLMRDVEGQLAVDLLNENNQFHDKSDIFKIYEKALDGTGTKQTSENSITEPTKEVVQQNSTDKALPEKEVTQGNESESSSSLIAKKVIEALKTHRHLRSDTLFKWATEAFGGTQGEGRYTPKDAYDALELGINQYLANDFKFDSKDPVDRIKQLEKLISLVPTQTKRTKEQDEFQQYSTPPTLAYVASWVADLKKDDSFLEPSAGIGGIAVFAKIDGVKTIAVNEFSERRREVLKEMGFSEVFGENAEQLDNVLPESIKPTVIVMNPPFSATGGRLSKNKTKYGALHIEQALKRLEPGGRLVAIVGEGMAAERPTFRNWWKNISSEYTVQANVGMNGEGYKKYGTTFDNQLLVIDKTGPTTNTVITGKVDNYTDLIPLLQGVRDERTVTAEQRTDKPIGEGKTSTSKNIAKSNETVQSTTPNVGAGERGAENGPGSGGQNRTDASVATESVDVANSKPGPGKPNVDKPIRQESISKGSSLENTGPDREPVSGIDTLKTSRQEKKPQSSSSDSQFEGYIPTVVIEGSKPHPADLVESAAMSAVKLPVITYQPSIPKEVVTSGKLSEVQLEAITAAGQAHQDTLPNGETRGFFIGDGTGVGKGREIAGILFDNWNQGRKRSIWVSKDRTLAKDAKRDINGIGWSGDVVIEQGSVKAGQPIPDKDGVLYTAYSTVSSSAKEGQLSRLQSLIDWAGPDFDGVIAFDESHKMGNAISIKEGRYTKKPSQMALAALDLQRALPKAKVVYVSATGATEVSNLAYAERLGLWGDGTAFANATAFIGRISQGGIAAMEVVARDMKAMGSYLARKLAYNGNSQAYQVKYKRLEHELSTQQREIYDDLAGGWQHVLANIDEALQITEADSNGRSHALSAFWGSHQRFFNQVLTAMQMPSVISSIKQDIKDGKAVVLQITNTNEASTNRALANAESLEDVDITPRDQLMQMIENSFPVQQYEKYTDEDGNERTRPVVDSNGNPVINREAVAKREALLNKLGSIRVPDAPLDQILNVFGIDKVAEVTGRSKRIVTMDDGTGPKKVRQSWSKLKGVADASQFMDDKKQILIFSEAGGTGASYHADNSVKNQRQRSHYILQAGWRADSAIQGLGRSHRSNQAIAPEYILVTTDLKGHKRFISSIARKLSQLGALTEGERKASSQGLFTERDNLESEYATDAVTQLIHNVQRGAVTGLDMPTLVQELGMPNLVDDHGQLNTTQIPTVPRFLNRILSMKIDMQNKVFDLFSAYLDANVTRAEQDGTLDTGLETLKAKKIKVVDTQPVYTDERSGAVTEYVQLDVDYPVDKRPYDPKSTVVVNNQSGMPWRILGEKSVTDEAGNVNDVFMLQNGRSSIRNVLKEGFNEKFTTLKNKSEANSSWNKGLDSIPDTVTQREHLITGALLPIWDKLIGHPKIVRVVTDKETMLGRIIPGEHISEVMAKLDVEGKAVELSPEEAQKTVLENGQTLTLDNGWKITRRRVANENRMEVEGTGYGDYNILENYGAFTERISYVTRNFIPIGDTGNVVLERILKNNKILTVSGGQANTRQQDNVSESLDSSVTTTEPQQTSTIKDQLQKTANSPNKEVSKLAQFLQAFVPASKLDIPVNIDPKATTASYNSTRNIITLTDTSNGKSTIHEVVHGVTVREMQKNPQLRRRVLYLMKQTKAEVLRLGLISKENMAAIESAGGSKAFKNRFPAGTLSGVEQIAYGLLNEKEFLSQAFSSKEFQDILKSIPIENKGWVRNAWDAFVEAVMKALNIPMSKHTVFSEALKVTAELAGVDLNATDKENLTVGNDISENLLDTALSKVGIDTKSFANTYRDLMADDNYIKKLPTDSTIFSKLFSSPEYTFKKAAAAWRVYQVQENRMDNKIALENQIFGQKTGKDGKKTGFIQTMQEAKKKFKQAYKKANDYLINTDRTGNTLTMKREAGWTVNDPQGKEIGFAETQIQGLKQVDQHYKVMKKAAFSKWVAEQKADDPAFKAPKLDDWDFNGKLRADYKVTEIERWAVVDAKGKEVSRFDSDAEAQKDMMDREGAALEDKGFSKKSIELVRSYREMTNNAFNLMIADLRNIIQTAKEEGLDEPSVSVVDESKRWVYTSKDGNKHYFSSKADAQQAGGSSGTIKEQKDGEIRKEMKLSEVIAMMSDLRGSYFARQRNRGSIVLRAEKKGVNGADDQKVMKKFDFHMVEDKYVDFETGQEFNRTPLSWMKKSFNFTMSKIPGTLAKEMNQLKREGYTILSVGKETSMPESVFEAAQLVSSISAMLDEAKTVAEKKGANKKAMEETNKLLTQAIASIVQQRGYMSSRMKRNSNYWSGFEQDMLLSGTQYARGLSAGIAKKQAAKAFIEAVTGRDISWQTWKADNPAGNYDQYLEMVEKRKLDPMKQPGLYGDTMGFIKDMLRNEEQVDRVLGTIQGVAVLKFLGLRVSSAAVNATNMIQAVPATISSHSGGTIHGALAEVGRAAVTYGKFKMGKDISKSDRNVLLAIINNGWDEAQFNKESVAVLQSKFGRGWNEVSEFSMKMFGAVEKVNRATTILAAYNQFKKNTSLTDAECLEKAKHASDRAHGVYGKATRPVWTRGAWNPLRMAFTFAKFSQNYAMNMAEMGLKGDSKQAACMLLSPAVLAGTGATLASPVLFALANALGVGGDDPEEEFYKWAEDTFGTDRVARHGLAGLFGVNLKGSIQMNNPMPTKLSEIFGAPGAIFTDVAKGAKAIGKGEFLKGAEALLPTGIGTMVKATREATEGISTGSYSPVYYGDQAIKADGIDATLRFFGFNPSSISGIREKQWHEKQVYQKFQERRNEINTMIKRFGIYGKGDQYEIYKEIQRYNELVRGSGRRDLSLINPSKQFRSILKRARTPGKLEKYRDI